MQITNHSVVTFDYVLRNEDGEILDTSEGRQPLTYIQGLGQVIPGVEKALAGKLPGDMIRFVVEPDEGYGEYDPEAVRAVQRDAFPADVQLEEGMEFLIEGEDGQPQPVMVQAIEDDVVYLDFNHPLAGEVLDFEITVRKVRAATPEEIAHGHAHG